MSRFEDDGGIALKRARAFREIIRCGSTRRAAKAMGITQSAVSQQLKLFEEFVGEKLFIRDRRGLIPTARAFDIYKRIDRFFETLVRIEREIIGSFGASRERVTIAAPHLVCLSLVPGLISELDRVNMSVDFYVKALGYDQIAQSILTEEAELGISRLPLDDRFFEWRTIAVSKSVCLVHPEHPLAGRDRISIDDLSGDRFIILEREYASHHTGLNAMLYDDHNAIIRIRTDAVGFGAPYVAEGLGVTIVNEFICRESELFNVKAVPFYPSATYEYVVFWRRGIEKTSTHYVIANAIADIARRKHG